MTVRLHGYRAAPALAGAIKDGSNDDRESCTPVSVSRQIRAPAGELSGLFAESARHPGADGSGC